MHIPSLSSLPWFKMSKCSLISLSLRYHIWIRLVPHLTLTHFRVASIVPWSRDAGSLEVERASKAAIQMSSQRVNIVPLLFILVHLRYSPLLPCHFSDIIELISEYCWAVPIPSLVHSLTAFQVISKMFFYQNVSLLWDLSVVVRLLFTCAWTIPWLLLYLFNCQACMICPWDWLTGVDHVGGSTPGP